MKKKYYKNEQELAKREKEKLVKKEKNGFSPTAR